MGERQYYYFYGSTSEGAGNGSRSGRTGNTNTNGNGTTSTAGPASQAKGESTSAKNRTRPPSSSSPGAVTESDSLIGEGLVQTDNEEEGALPNSDADFQQLHVSRGTSGRLHTLATHSERPSRSRGQTLLHSCVKRYRRFRRSHSVSHLFLIAAGAMLFVSLVALLFLSPGASGNSSSSSSTSQSTEDVAKSSVNPTATARQRVQNFQMTWPQIDRSDYNDPVTNFMDPSLFHSRLLRDSSHGTTATSSSSSKHEFIFPFPTGAFWTNLVLPPTADRGLSYPIAVYPYAYKWSESLLEVSYPAQHRKEEVKAIHDYFFPDLTFTVGETMTERKITAFDPLSVTLRFATDRNNCSWETYLVQGSPYVTIKYSQASPIIKAFSTFTDVLCPREDLVPMNGNNRQRRLNLNHGVCSSSSSNNNNNSESTTASTNRPPQLSTTTTTTTTLHGVQFTIETQEGVRWAVFASELATLTFDTQTRTTIVVSAENGGAFTGVLRFAILPPTRDQLHGSDSVTTQTSTALHQILDSSGMKRLIYHAGVYPVSGAVHWSFRSVGSASNGADGITDLPTNVLNALSGNSQSSSSSSTTASSTTAETGKSNNRVGVVDFKFETRSFTPTTTGPKTLLMLALPHHAQSLPLSSQLDRDNFELVYTCIKGPMRPVLGSEWSYEEPLPSLGFDGDTGSNSDRLFVSPNVRAKILTSLVEDVKLALPTATENIYGFGKQAARLAQLAHIAHVLLLNGGKNTTTMTTASPVPQNPVPPQPSESENADENANAIASSVLQEAKNILRDSLDNFLRSKVADSLVFDANLGGMVTTDGLLNSNADFGNGRYNDHHFHYGYLLYACAVMGKLDPLFVEEFGDAVDAFFYDIANDSNFEAKASTGAFFPGARHKIWFDGHSFASGMFPFGNGKSQESSSEAVNGYYGAYLWSVVRNGAAEDPASDESPQTDFARLLLAMEIRGAKTYWHMVPPKPGSEEDTIAVYSPQFSQNYMVGNLGMLDALCSTWFGNEELYVHMINFLPVTSVTGDLFNPEFVSREYSKVLKPLGEVAMAWLGYIVANKAIVDPNSAWLEAENLFSPTLDSALSKSQVLYWISTRSDFNASNVVADPSDRPLPPNNNKDRVTGDAACSTITACANAGLLGLCCPTDNGVFLDCCYD